MIQNFSKKHPTARPCAFTVFTYSAPSINNNDTDRSILLESDIDFILSHLSDPLFPRKISTQKSHNKQFRIDNKEEIINAFKESDNIDSRISAFPLLKLGSSWVADLLFIDLDLSDFSNKKLSDSALTFTLKNISNYLGDEDEEVIPTVLFTGHGYHIIQPVNCPVPESRFKEVFQDFVNNKVINNPSEEFLRFAKVFLSDDKADKRNNPSFRSCLLRVPNSYNGKYLIKEGLSKEDSKVRIIQKWNGIRFTLTPELFTEYGNYLIQKKIDRDIQLQKILIEINKRRKNQQNQQNNKNNNYYQWIDQLLETPLEDCRKLLIDLVLSPYLINIKKLSFEESFKIITNWLDKCDSLERLDNSANFNYRIRQALKTATSKQIPPMRLSKIKTDNTYERVHILFKNKGIIKL